MIEFRAIDSVRAYDSNPCMDDQTVGAVTTSMSGFEFRQSVVDSDGAIIAGHIDPALTDGQIFTNMLHHEQTVGDAIF